MANKWIPVIGLVVIAAFFAYLAQQGSLGFTLTTTEAQKTGGFISVPTYGYLKCEQSQNINSYPAQGFELFDAKMITCQQYGTLLQECDVILRTPSSAEIGSKTTVKNAGMIFRVCTTGQVCDVAAGDKGTVITMRNLFIDYDSRLNMEIPIHLGPNQFLYVEYQEAGLIGSAHTAEKGKFRVDFKPWFVNRYDVFSLATGSKASNPDCVFSGQPGEANFIIEDVRGGGKLSQQLSESQLTNLVSIRSREARITYISNFVAIVPQYQLFESDTKYCYDKRIYRVEEIETPSGVYKVANTQTNAAIQEVECCNSGDVPTGYYCKDFVKTPLSTSSGQECNALLQCPIVGYQAIPGKKVVYQQCVENKCVNKYMNVKCSYNEECPGGYCQVDALNPANNECKYISPIDKCGNGVCEPSLGESAQTCKDCVESSGLSSWLPWAILAAALIIAAALIFSRPRKKRR